MKRAYLKTISHFLSGCMMLLTIPVVAQTIVSESFDGTFPPTGWTGGGGGPGALWVQRMTGTNPACMPHSGAAMARYSSFNSGGGTQDEFVTPVFDLTGSAGYTPTFSLWVYRDGNSTAGDSVTIFVNTSTALTGAVRIGAVARSRYFVLPINETSDGWYQYTFDIPPAFNTDSNFVILQGTAHGGGNIYIDDVEWTAYPPACSGPPTPGTIASDLTLICGGSGSANLTLNGASSGASGITYQWQTGPTDTGPWTDFGTSTLTVNTGIISVDSWFRCVITCGPSALSDSTAAILITVSPNAAPVVTITPDSNVFYCSGTPPILLVASGASTYTWTPNIAVPNGVGDSAYSAPTINITYVIIGSDSSGCSDTTTVSVQFRLSPNVTASTNNDTICSGESTNLQASLSGPGFGIQYTWTPGPLIGPNHNVSPATTTTYIVEAYNTQTTCADFDTVVINVNPSNSASFTYSYVNQTVTFDNTSTGGTSWFWEFGDSSTSTDEDPVHTYIGNNVYTVTLIVSNGLCPDDTLVQQIIVGPIGLQDSDGYGDLLLYPNPANDYVNLKFYAADSELEVKVFDELGRTVISRLFSKVTSDLYNINLDVRHLTHGTYMLQIVTESNTIVRSFVVGN